jgi:hypothetical protein
MACPVSLTVRLTTEHADVGSLERTVAVARTEAGVTLWGELVCPTRGRPRGSGGLHRLRGFDEGERLGAAPPRQARR